MYFYVININTNKRHEKIEENFSKDSESDYL